MSCLGMLTETNLLLFFLGIGKPVWNYLGLNI